MRRYSRHRLELRHRFYEILEQGPIGNWIGRLAGGLIVLLIVINLFAVVLESSGVRSTVSRPVRGHRGPVARCLHLRVPDANMGCG